MKMEREGGWVQTYNVIGLEDLLWRKQLWICEGALKPLFSSQPLLRAFHWETRCQELGHPAHAQLKELWPFMTLKQGVTGVYLFYV